MGNKTSIGERYGKLKVIAFAEEREYGVGTKRKRAYVSLLCDCGNIIERAERSLSNTSHCGCSLPKRAKDLTGRRYGRLTIIGRSVEVNLSGKSVHWDATCSCGNTKTGIPSSSLVNGTTLSCGCILTERRGAPLEEHGMRDSREYSIWSGMVSRCENASESTREYYFDKGISISPEWRRSFKTFYADMGNCPEGYSLDRIDSSKGYSKENCRWASPHTQAVNRGMFKNNTSGTKGVSQTANGNWAAYIWAHGKRYHLGTFADINEAKEVRKAAEVIYHSGAIERCE